MDEGHPERAGSRLIVVASGDALGLAMSDQSEKSALASIPQKQPHEILATIALSDSFGVLANRFDHSGNGQSS